MAKYLLVWEDDEELLDARRWGVFNGTDAALWPIAAMFYEIGGKELIFTRDDTSFKFTVAPRRVSKFNTNDWRWKTASADEMNEYHRQVIAIGKVVDDDFRKRAHLFGAAAEIREQSVQRALDRCRMSVLRREENPPAPGRFRQPRFSLFPLRDDCPD